MTTLQAVVDLSEIPDHLLQAELARRQEERQEAARVARLEYNDQVYDLLEWILPLLAHTGEDCSDEHTYNRLPLQNSGGQVPCARCFLADMQKQGVCPDLELVELSLSMDVKVLPGHPEYEG